MKDPEDRFFLAETTGRTCGEDGGDQRRRVQFAFGHAQVAADVFTRLEHSRINDHVRYNSRCSNLKESISTVLFRFSLGLRTLELNLGLGEGFQAGGNDFP